MDGDSRRPHEEELARSEVSKNEGTKIKKFRHEPRSNLPTRSKFLPIDCLVKHWRVAGQLWWNTDPMAVRVCVKSMPAPTVGKAILLLQIQ